LLIILATVGSSWHPSADSTLSLSPESKEFAMRIVSVLGLVFLAACNGKGDDSGSAGDGGSATDGGGVTDGGGSDGGGTTGTFDDATLASELWTAIASYDGWSQPDGWSASPVLSSNHMGAYVVGYDNATLAAWDGTGSAPDGAIALKENFGDEAGTSLMNLTVMEKVSGYDADHGDWFWAEYNPDGTVVASGKVDMCYGCHSAAATDYLFADPPAGM